MRSGLLEAVEKPLDTPLWQLVDADLLADLSDLLLVRDRIEARLSATLAEVATRGLPDRPGDVRLDTLVREQAPNPVGVTEQRRLARRVWVRAQLPLVARLHDAGEVSTAFLDAAGTRLEELPREARTVLDETLAGNAGRHCDPRDIRVLTAQMRVTADPDEADGRAVAQEASHRLTMSPVGSDGAYVLDATLYGTEAERVHAMLTHRAEMLKSQGDEDSPARRRAAALYEIFGIAERAVDDAAYVAAPHGTGVHVTVVATAQAWSGEPGAPAAITAEGTLLSPAELAVLKCSTPDPDVLVVADAAPDAASSDAKLLARSVTGLVTHPLSHRLVPLAYGRSARTATRAQWLTLVARDRHCVYPGCTAPPRRCRAHHLREYAADRGLSDIANYALLCQSCHLKLHALGRHIHPPWCTCHPAQLWVVESSAPLLT